MISQNVKNPKETESGPRRQGPGGRAQAAGNRRQGPGGRAQAAAPRRQGPGGRAQAARALATGLRRQGPGGRAQATRVQAAGPRQDLRGRAARPSPGGRAQGPDGRAQGPSKQTRAQKTKERWAWEVRLSPVRQRLSPKALCRRKAEAAAQPRTAWRNPEKRKKGQKNSDDGGPQNSIFEIMPLGPPKGADTPPRGEGRGPSKFDFRNHDAWTPPKEQTPLHEERGGGPQNSIFEIMTLGPPKEARHAMASRGRVQPETMKQRLLTFSKVLQHP